ncbi:MAG: DEAD/DEAH box helicase, partial [Candidatus Lokiarchaeota archaeon]|nr:DEAD/DEAH box helicase [Candidatus Lokiarchaeota archaeon]MBD3202262.1 DEAD/DEAH box helicase [Candidatus Lokiarchaeota archaeon]
VVIPTGLGKTIVALMLAVHRLTEYPESKVIFLAPTKPLVNQHFESFLESTTLSTKSLKSITGSVSPDQRKEIWNEVRIAFMTPQVLQNDIISGLYDLENVSLIIFDECHRAVGDYAYSFLAKKYVDSAKNPKILGLTASPGSTKEKIMEIKENLFINHIEIRTEKDRDVKPYVHDIDRDWIKIELPKEFSEIIDILNEKLKEIYKFLKKNELLNSYDVNKITRKDLLKLNKIINRKISLAREDGERYSLFYAKKLQANAIRISHMIELIETQGINAFQDYIKKNELKIKKNTANKSLKELFNDNRFKHVLNLANKIQSDGIIHPKLGKLSELLHEQFNQNTESRVLVFSHFRDSVNNIVRYFEDDDLIRAHKFVGQAHKGNDKGLTQKQQIELLQEFKDGFYNTLIGTSVAEEGLDIAECDLVVFYDVVPSAVRSIQRRGRTGRKRKGKVYILMAKGTRDEGYYWAEKAKERNMKRNLRNLKEKQRGNNQIEQKDLTNFMNKNSQEDEPEKQGENPNEIKNEENVKESVLITEKIEGAEEHRIICDNRETSSPVVRNLSLMGVELQLEQLEVADYVISERVGIERKSAADFSDSIKDGRLFRELIDLNNNFERSILILEENPFNNSHINQNAIYGAITSIILNLGITIYRTSDAKETSMFLYHLAKKEQQDTKRDTKLRFKKAPIELSYLLEYIISGVPGVNTSRAKNLLKGRGTLQSIFNADIGDLMKVENIGKKIAQEIYKISRFKYKNNSEDD